MTDKDIRSKEGPLFPEKKADAESYSLPVSKSEVPSGSIKEVEAWVGDDKSRATAALAAEKSGDKRSTLIDSLEKVVNADGLPPAASGPAVSPGAEGTV